MTAMLLTGKEPAAIMRAAVAGRVGALAADGVRVGLATILVGDDAASAVYVGMKHKTAVKAGITSIDRRLEKGASQAEVDAAIDDLNEDPALGEAQVIGLKAARNAIVGLLENARALTLAISLVALVVALLGILNTVLMSVFERTPQIGTMKAIGAEDSDVFRIILGETFLISLFGALLGVAVALLGSDAVASLVRGMLPFAPSGDLVQIRFGPAATVVAGVVGIGVVAGIFPALRAARTDPINAIRTGE